MTVTKNVEENGIHVFENSENSDNSKLICNGLKKLNSKLVHTFYWLGYKVGLRPRYFIVIPFIISLVLSTGLIFIEYEEDPLKLFVPYTAPFIQEQKIVEAHFPMNYSYYYDPTRFTRHEGHSRVIINAKDDKSIFRSILWPEIMDLDRQLRNITVADENGEELVYEDMCAKWLGKCVQNTALNINDIVGEVENGTTKINYPVMIVPFILPQLLGGIVVNESASRVVDAKAVLLAYFLNIDAPEKSRRAYEWEKKMLDFLKAADYKYIHLSFFASRSIADELKIKMDSCIPYIPVTGFIMIAACMSLLWMSDCIRSKPLIGLVGIVSAIISAGAAFGFLIYCRTVYTRLNVVALFLVLGIGVDDIFVAISAWQKTSTADSVPKRLAQTYADAAVSVTITSLTNAMAFAVGTTTPALIVQAFCLYSCITIIFAYIYFITFCGGFLAIAGYMEEQGRHSLFLVKVKEISKDESSFKKRFYSIFCASASQGKNTEKNNEFHVHVISAFFRDSFGTVLCNGYFQVLVLISYLGYLAGGIYGLTVLREGLFRHRMALDDSYFVDVSKRDDRYFRHMPYSIQAVITGNITYSDPETQKKLLDLEAQFQNLPYGSEPIFTQSWLGTFLKRLKRRKPWQEEIQDEKSFIKVVREKFMTRESHLSQDLEYNHDYSRILASRMVFQAANVKDVFDDVVMMDSYRKIAKDSEFNVTCFHLLFSLFDQHYMMKPLAIQSILIAIVVVVFVSLLFIPDIRGSISIAFSVLSIAVGVIGYMAFWHINLDHVSAGSIFMCIGFSVDFSAHISYTYLSSRAKTSEGKIRESLQCLGLPILQGAFTTVLSLVTFLLIPGYGYRTFFKTILLVTIFAAYHSIILIPLFLAKLEDCRSSLKNRSKPENTIEPISSFRRIDNGSLKPIAKERTTANTNGTSKNETHKETDFQTKQEDEIMQGNSNKMNNGYTNGNVHKLEESSKTEKNSNSAGIDNEAFSSD